MKTKKKGGLFAGVLMGIVMVIAGTILLWWNEGNNVRNIKTTNEVEKNVVEIAIDANPAEYNGKLIATGGSFTVEDEALTDDTFGVSVHSAALVRVVEVYQWEETEVSDDDGTSYNYEKGWHEGLIDSSSFHENGHNNPSSVDFNSDSKFAEKVTLGNFKLSSAQIEQMEANKNLGASEAKTIPEGYKASGDYVTNSANLSSPQIGDVRITWKYNDWKEVSIIAKVSGDSFVAYTSEVGKDVNYVTDGVKTAAQMIEAMRNADKMIKWLLRLFGFLLIFMGYMSFISPLTKLFGYIPILGSVVNFAFALSVFLLSVVHSLIVIIIAWFRYRPMLCLILGGVVVVAVILILLLKKKRPAPATQAA